MKINLAQNPKDDSSPILLTTFWGSTLNDYNRLVERETGFEPATSTLARLHSTTELFPQEPLVYKYSGYDVNRKSEESGAYYFPTASIQWCHHCL
jgi:hypothetical protein